MSRVTRVRFCDIPYAEAGFCAKRATGMIGDIVFKARQYEDRKGGPRGAEPVRWRVVGVGVGFSQGLRSKIAARLNWLLSHCQVCHHPYNASGCFSCKLDSGPCRRRKCRVTA